MNEDLSQAFITQAQKHLRDDFMPRLGKCVDQLTHEQLWWRPNENCNSVGNLLLHLSGNVRQWIIAGVGGQPDTRQRDEEFAARQSGQASQLMEKLQATVDEACQVLDSLTAADLLETRRIQVYDVSVLSAVFHVVEHFSHHVGQVIYITKALRDRDLEFYRGL
ncbi:MAG TPA: DinB family protein [Acidobacteriota bacterium]|nr:DinB family protein [Acidobacteriota bacterium]